MKRFLFIAVAVVFVFSVFGCAKKEQAMEGTQEGMTMEALSTVENAAPTAPQAQAPAATTQVQPQAASTQLALPPTGPYQPTAQEIQTALKNAGFYAGEIDGKIGPKSKQAIEDFQKANGLKVDGKVGPKTWAALSKFLTQSATSSTR